MEFNLRSKTYGHIRFTSVVPASFAKWVILGSRRYIAKGNLETFYSRRLRLAIQTFIIPFAISARTSHPILLSTDPYGAHILLWKMPVHLK